MAAPRLRLDLPPEITVEKRLNMLRLERELYRLPAISASATLRYAWRLRVEGPVSSQHTLRATLLAEGAAVASGTLDLAVGTDRDRALAPVDETVEEVVLRYEIGRDQEVARDAMRSGNLTGAMKAMSKARKRTEQGLFTAAAREVDMVESALRILGTLKRTAPEAHETLGGANRRLQSLVSSLAYGNCARGFRAESDERTTVRSIRSIAEALRGHSNDPAVVTAAGELDELVKRST